MDKRLKILLEEVKGSDPNLDTMDRNTRVRAGNYQFPFSGQQLDYLLLTLAKKLSGDDILIFSDLSNPQTVLTEITKYQLDDPSKIYTSYEVVFGTYLGTLRIDSQDTASVSILQSGKIIYCNMDLTDGQVTLEKEIQLDDLDKVTHEEHILTLEIGDSAEVSERNLEKLRANAGEHFLCNLDYGYGVGRWNPTDGGSSVIMTSEGIKTSWDLAPDGSISKIEDEILPDVPYRVSVPGTSINTVVDEVIGSQIIKASVLVIEGGSTGPISYLRCVDSTSSVIQFASITKDLRLSVLSYDVSARNLTQAFVNIKEEPEGIANSLYQYLGFTEEELTAEQFKNGLKKCHISLQRRANCLITL
jgi:hypothetical protein